MRGMMTSTGNRSPRERPAPSRSMLAPALQLRARMTRTIRAGVLLAVFAVAPACALDEPDDAPGADPEEIDDEVAAVAGNQAAAVGCAAIVVSEEDHTGALIGYTTSHPELYVAQVKFRIRNPSAVDCATVQIGIRLVDDLPYTTTLSTSLTTSLRGGYRRWIYWTINWDSRNTAPAWDYTQDVFVSRNGNEIDYTYLPSYFVNTGQY